jgi:hypothetical protein
MVIIGLITVMSLGLMANALKTGAPMRYADEQQYVDIATSLSLNPWMGRWCDRRVNSENAFRTGTIRVLKS